jgi:L-aspartate oxidase
MSRHAGVLRDAAGLADAIDTLDAITAKLVPGDVRPCQSSYEATNVLTVARAVLAAALARTESRGCHRRIDYPEPRPEWVVHLEVGLSTSPEAGPVAVVGGPVAPLATR